MEYMQKMYISNDIISAKDISSGYNVMNPNYIARCIDKSLLNLKLGVLIWYIFIIHLRAGMKTSVEKNI